MVGDPFVTRQKEKGGDTRMAAVEKRLKPEVQIDLRFSHTTICNNKKGEKVGIFMDISHDLQDHVRRIVDEIRRRDTTSVEVRIKIRTTILDVEEE